MLKFWGKAGIIAAFAMLTVAPLAASAQAPSYAQSGGAYHEDEIRGVVTSFNGHYDLQVRDRKGYIDNVKLHQGTVINPTGLTLQPGMSVTIYGEPNGTHFDANIINTPYHYVPVAYPAPYGPWGPHWGWRLGFGW